MRLGFIKWLLVGFAMVMLSGCGGGSGSGEPSSQDVAIAKIKSYVRDGDTAPGVEVYRAAGVTGVDTGNIDEVNAAVASHTAAEVDTPAKIQLLVNGLSGGTTHNNISPIAQASATPIATIQGEVITFDGSTSTDSDGAIVKYEWTEGASVLHVGISFTEDNLSVGTHTVMLTITDDDHATDSTTVNITVQSADRLSMQVKKTGQDKSYDENGTEIIDGSVRDDGYYQSGREAEYNLAEKGSIVIDSVSNLIWAMDEKKDLSNMSDAVYYCSNLELAGYDDWRLPSSLELLDIVDRSFYDISSYGSKSFDSNTRWWFSSTYERNGSFKFYYLFDIRNGKQTQRQGGGLIRGSVKCVRGEPLTRDTYVRDDVKDVVTASLNHLVWQDNADAVHYTYTWKEALSYCEELTLAGESDWRLPNSKELRSLVDYHQIADREASGIDRAFKNKGSYRDYYYSSSSRSSYKAVVNTYGGEVRFYRSYTKNRVRCVRGGQ